MLESAPLVFSIAVLVALAPGVAAGSPQQASLSQGASDEAGVGTPGDTSSDVIAQTLHRLAELLIWPEAAMAGAQEPFRICSVGADQLDGVLESLNGSIVSDRPVVVNRFESARDLEFCHVMFIGTSEAYRQGQLVEVLRPNPILTVSENEGFLEAGGMVQLTREPRGVVHTVDRAVVLAAGLDFRRKELQLVGGTGSSGGSDKLWQEDLQDVAGDSREAGPSGTGLDPRSDAAEIRLAIDQEAEAAKGSEATPRPSDEYVIGPGDVLTLDVFGHEELSRKVRVETTGSVRLPLIGKLEVEGLSLDEAERAFADRLSERRILNDPQLSVSVEEYHSQSVSIQGAVENPGVYQLLGRRTLLEVLGEAGGLVASNNQRAGTRAFILRLGAEEQGERLEIDLQRLMTEGDMSLNVVIEAGDIVLIPPEEESRVFVSGAVEKPGPVTFGTSEPITILQALSYAGGTTLRARLGKVTVLRKRPDGGEDRLYFDVKKIRKGERPDVLLQNNDTVLVSEWSF